MSKVDAVRRYLFTAVGNPYIYGGTGKLCTPAYRRGQIKQYPDFTDQITRYCPVLSLKQGGCFGCPHSGKLAYDCAQLTRLALLAAGINMPSGATSQWKASLWSEKGTIDTLPHGEMVQIFRQSGIVMQHTGIALGDGTFVDARGHRDGVLRSPMSSYKWTHWGRHAGLSGRHALPAEAVAAPITKPSGGGGSMPFQRTLQVIKGQKLMRGTDVLKVQQQLVALGFTVGANGADSVYGWDTHAAVRAFQLAKGLAADGTVGDATRAALDKAASQTAPQPVRFTATIPGLTEAQAKGLLTSWPQASIVQMPSSALITG